MTDDTPTDDTLRDDVVVESSDIDATQPIEEIPARVTG
jgi:hypothetical protein